MCLNGTMEWFLNGKRHNAKGAAVVFPDKTEEHWLEGVPQMLCKSSKERHLLLEGNIKESEHAISFSNREGSVHRDNGPAVIVMGEQSWFRNGQRHRDDGPAWIRKEEEIWFQDGFIHRDGAPARIKSSGLEEWYQRGRLHREDGPAQTLPGTEGNWYYKGKLTTQAKLEKRLGL